MNQLPSFKNSDLFDLALTHRSYTNEHSDAEENNERLEFLGDAVLGFVIAEMLYSMYPTINEAQLTHLRSRLVDEKQLGKLGSRLWFGKTEMRLGRGAAKDGGRNNPSLLNDTFEARFRSIFFRCGNRIGSPLYIRNFSTFGKTASREFSRSNRSSASAFDSS